MRLKSMVAGPGGIDRLKGFELEGKNSPDDMKPSSSASQSDKTDEQRGDDSLEYAWTYNGGGFLPFDFLIALRRYLMDTIGDLFTFYCSLIYRVRRESQGAIVCRSFVRSKLIRSFRSVPNYDKLQKEATVDILLENKTPKLGKVEIKKIDFFSSKWFGELRLLREWMKSRQSKASKIASLDFFSNDFLWRCVSESRQEKAGLN
ncbi:hypothetical protein EYC84_005858 [Monilinia fructicola]|uniref:Uncharacterized protein n=2 Tax=Monilinia fructicola TaxID=38448 RepID=A0A5M9JYT8_MONFR|nr:hypothetical protein EYC84_005858 [Monilinia fructicola]